MPEKKTMERAKKDKAEGKSASTQAGEFVREEMHHIREGKHGAKNTKQAIAIGLSKARRAGVKAPAKKGSATKATRRRAKQDTKRASSKRKTSPKRSRASERALKRQPRSAASHRALSRQARSSAKRRSKRGGSNSPRAAARRAARTRRAHSH